MVAASVKPPSSSTSAQPVSTSASEPESLALLVLTDGLGHRCRTFLFAQDWSALAQTCTALRADLRGSFVDLGTPARSLRWLADRLWRFGQTWRVAHLNLGLPDGVTLADVEAQMVKNGVAPSDVTSVLVSKGMPGSSLGVDGAVDATGIGLLHGGEDATDGSSAAEAGDGMLKSLTSLRVDDVNPGRDLCELGALHRLERLVLRRCQAFLSLVGMEALPRLAHVEIDFALMLEGLEVLGECAALESLVLRKTSIDDMEGGRFPSLAACRNLRHVTLANLEELFNLDFLADNARLEYLAVVDTEVSEVGDALKKSARSLRTVIFHGNKRLPGLDALAGLREATEVCFSSNGDPGADGADDADDAAPGTVAGLGKARVLDFTQAVASSAHTAEILAEVELLAGLERLTLSAAPSFGVWSDASVTRQFRPARVVEALGGLRFCERLVRLDLDGVLEAHGLTRSPSDVEDVEAEFERNAAEGEVSGLRELRLSRGLMSSLAFVGCLFPNLVRLHLADLRRVSCLCGLERLAKLEVLHLHDMPLDRLCSLDKCVALRVLSVQGCPDVERLDGLRRCNRLEVVTLWDLHAKSQPGFFDPLQGSRDSLRVLRLRQCRSCAGLGQALAAHARLEAVSVQGCSGVGGLHKLRGGPALRNVALDGAVHGATLKKPLSGLEARALEARALGEDPAVEVCNLSVCDNAELTSLRGAPRLFRGLRRLWALGLPKLVSLDALTVCERLTELSLGCAALQSLAGIAATAPTLERLSLAGCQALASIGPLESFARLVALDLSSCKCVTDLSPLVHCHRLRDLSMAGTSSLSSVGVLANHRALRQLDLGILKGSQLVNVRNLSGLDAVFVDSVGFTPEQIGHVATTVNMGWTLFKPRTLDVDAELFGLSASVLADDDLDSLAPCFEAALEFGDGEEEEEEEEEEDEDGIEYHFGLADDNSY